MRVRRACSLVIVVASSASAAPAELAVGDLQLELEPRRDITDETSTDPYYRYAGFAQLSGGGSGGADVGAGAAIAVAGLGCDFVHGTAQGRLRFDETYAGEATYSLCVSRLLLTAVFSGRRGVGVEPSFDARRSLWAMPYDERYDRAEIAFGEYWDDPQSRHTLVAMALGHGELRQAERTVVTIDFDFSLYRFRRLADETVALDVIVVTSEALKAGVDNQGGLATTFIPVRARYEDDQLWFAARAGVGSTGGAVTASTKTEVNGETTSEWSDTINSEGLPDMTMFVGEIEAGTRGSARGRIETSARISRGFYPTFDGNIAREARLAGTVSYAPGRTGRTKLTLSPFAARTKTWTREQGASREISAGASLYYGRELTRHLRVDAIGQLGVSPYARLGDDRVAASRFGGQLLVALTGRVTDLHR